MKIEVFNDKKLLKSRLIKTATKVVSIVSVAAMLATSGLSMAKNKLKANTNANATSIETVIEDLNNGNLEISNANQDKIDETRIAFVDYVHNMDTHYMYEEYYEIDEALAHNYKTPHLDSHCNEGLQQYDKLTESIVYDIVTKNNKALKESNKEPFYYDVPDDLLHKYCQIVADEINAALEKDPSIDRASLLCRVENLKIFFEDNEAINGKMTQDGSIVLSPVSIDYKLKNYYQDRDMYEFYFRHELEHIYHMFCEDERDDNLVKGGVGIKFKSDRQSPLFWNWFYEGSAEKCAMNQSGQDASAYFFNVGYIESLTFSNILNSNVGINDTEETNRTREQQAFFDKFKNISEDELIRMMYALDLYIVKPLNFEMVYYGITEKEYTRAEQKLLANQLKASVMETLSKNFYLNLINAINDNIPLNDVIYLMRAWEVDMNSHIGFNTEERIDTNKDFMENYTKMQTYFFEYLCARYNISMKDLETEFKEFDPRSECQITWLDDDKKYYVVDLLEDNDEYIANNYSGTIIKPIREYNRILNNRAKSNTSTASIVK